MKQILFLLFATILAGQVWAGNEYVNDGSGWCVLGDFQYDYDGVSGPISITTSNCQNAWDAQFVTPSWKNIGNEGDKFTLTFNVLYVGDEQNPRLRIAAGKTLPYNNMIQGQIVNENGNYIMYGEDIDINNGEWNTITYDYYIGPSGTDSIRLEIDFGYNPGLWSFSNITLEVNDIVKQNYFPASNYISTNGIEYVLTDITGKAAIHKTNITDDISSVVIPSTVVKDGKTYSVTRIGKETFSNCRGLTSISIPESVTSIDDRAFYGCSGLTEIMIPNSVTSIGQSVFSGCNNLKKITIGSSVTTIGKNIFEGCNSLESIVCKSAYPPEVADNMLANNEKDRIILYVNAKLTIPNGTYRKVQPWCNFDFADDSNNEQKTDTIYVVNTSVSKFSIKSVSVDAKMGMAIGTGKYEKDEDAEIVAIEKYGYHFTKWADGNTDNPRYVKVSSDSTFKAEFEVNNYNVLAATNEKKMGRVEGADTYAYLSRTQLKAVPNDGYQFKEWSDGETANPRNILVYSDTTFTAVFVATEATAVAESAANAINIYAHGNTIVVENATDEIRVYNAMGALVGRDVACRVRAELQVNGAGVYIVKVGTVAKRVMIND